MFTSFLFHLRAEGIPVGTGEWLSFLEALRRGLATSLTELYPLGRALLCRTEADFDRYDLAFAAAFEGAALSDELRSQLAQWLERRVDPQGERSEPELADEELWRAFLERLAEQREEHNGGDRWIGTGGTSPFGHGGRGARGIRVGGSAGGRAAVSVALERRWESYRNDRTLNVRDLEVALRTLRKLVREGRHELDLDGTIRKTCDNAGEIEIVEQRARRNQVHLVLLMDAGGSMAPHHESVSRLFSAAERTKIFKSFTAYSFHNCVYGWLYRDIEQLDRVRAEEVLSGLTPHHRLIFVGDASMAPYELFNAFSWPGQGTGMTGLDWLQRFRARCPASVWINPDPLRYWDHPTVRAIEATFPMFELTVSGLHQAVQKLRAPV
ncbi:MAG TPA: VWA domain-containing protein [Deltaproteobacteria bacterium]|nr:VWA domain-containing protein [Deltaproteobacteria bacterium]